MNREEYFEEAEGWEPIPEEVRDYEEGRRTRRRRRRREGIPLDDVESWDYERAKERATSEVDTNLDWTSEE